MNVFVLLTGLQQHCLNGFGQKVLLTWPFSARMSEQGISISIFLSAWLCVFMPNYNKRFPKNPFTSIHASCVSTPRKLCFSSSFAALAKDDTATTTATPILLLLTGPRCIQLLFLPVFPHLEVRISPKAHNKLDWFWLTTT